MGKGGGGRGWDVETAPQCPDIRKGRLLRKGKSNPRCREVKPSVREHRQPRKGTPLTPCTNPPPLHALHGSKFQTPNSKPPTCSTSSTWFNNSPTTKPSSPTYAIIRAVSRILENQERRKGMIKRDYYLEKIKDKMWNGSVKIITGIRRCGKC